MRRVLLTLAAFSLAVLAAFTYGAYSFRQQNFAYRMIRAAAQAVGVARPRTVTQTPRSKAGKMLATLGYVHASVMAEEGREGVVTHDENRAFDGLNFYNSTRAHAARLMDMDGNVIREWSYKHPTGFWHHAELLPSGDLLVVLEDVGVARLNQSSELVWFYETRAHHDLHLDDQGLIYVISRQAEPVPELGSKMPVLYDKVVVLDHNGELQKEFSLLDPLLDSQYSFLLPYAGLTSRGETMEQHELDLTHANHIEVFDGSLSHHSDLYQEGNILLSMRHLNSIFILDGAAGEIRWLWGPNNVGWQHHSQALENGRILLFDNGFEESRILELDPRTREIAWSYSAGEDFFASWGGSVQRLPNGNTLITESPEGRVFEVTKDGEVVWEFLNPEVDNKGRRVNIWRMKRIDPSVLRFPLFSD